MFFRVFIVPRLEREFWLLREFRCVLGSGKLAALQQHLLHLTERAMPPAFTDSIFAPFIKAMPEREGRHAGCARNFVISTRRFGSPEGRGRSLHRSAMHFHHRQRDNARLAVRAASGGFVWRSSSAGRECGLGKTSPMTASLIAWAVRPAATL